jgi:hypothetical protein
MTDTKYGILLWNQATDWPSYAEAVVKLDELGYEHLWAWDHVSYTQLRAHDTNAKLG